MNRIVARRYAALGGVIAVFTVVPGAVLLAGKSAGEVGFGGAFLVAFFLFVGIFWLSSRKEVQTQYPQLPVIEATSDELRLVEPSGETFRVFRHGLASVVRLTAPGIRGSRILFRDSEDRTIAHWDLGWIAPIAMQWIGGLGYPTSKITGQKAVEAAYPDEDLEADGKGRRRRR